MAVEVVERSSVDLPGPPEAFVVPAMQEYSSSPHDGPGVLTLVAFTRLPLGWLLFQLLETATPGKALDSSRRAGPVLQRRVPLLWVLQLPKDGRKTDVHDSRKRQG